MSDWKRGDLCHVVGFGHDLTFKVTDPGMGRPRADIRVEQIDGPKVLRAAEGILTRPHYKVGMWVRSEDGDSYYRIVEMNVSRPYRYDMMKRRSDGEGLLSSTGYWGGGNSNWYPCVEPAMEDEKNYEKFLILELTEKLRAAQAEVESTKDWAAKEVAKIGNEHSIILGEKRRLDVQLKKCERDSESSIDRLVCQRNAQRIQKEEALAEIDRLRKENERLERWLDGVPDLKKRVSDAENAHLGALGQRDKEREGKWAAQAELRSLKEEHEKLKVELFLVKEKLRLKVSENRHLFALYEARIERDKKQNQNRIVM